jgi:hypothetical protein
MDKYTKVLLTVIAISVSLIAVKMYFPHINSKGAPTYGELLAIRNLDVESRREAFTDILNRLPLVRVHSGDIEVTGTVQID